MAVVTTTTDATVVATDLPAGRYVEWGPIILGTLGALAIMVVLMTFGGALGLSVTRRSPTPASRPRRWPCWRASTPPWSMSRASPPAAISRPHAHAVGDHRSRREPLPRRRPRLRGMGAGRRAGRGARPVGRERRAQGSDRRHHGGRRGRHRGRRGQSADAGGPAAALDAADRLCRRPPTGARARRCGAGSGGPAAGSRTDLAAPIARAFAANINNPQLDARDRTWLASLVSQRTGLPQADAEKRVDEAFAELKAAEQKARDAADKARKAALIAGFLAAATMAIGAAAACAGAALGARHRDERTLVVLFGSRRFW